jgi:hypothetical protein
MAKKKKPLVVLNDVYDWRMKELKTGRTPRKLAKLRKYWEKVGVFSVVQIGPDGYHMVFDAYFDKKGRIGVDPAFAPPPR